MFINFKKIILVIFGLFFVFFSKDVFAYSVETHAFLTDKIFDFYNHHFPQQNLSKELKPYLIEGARQEDNFPRYMNHFYDPVYERGLTDEIFGFWQKSKDWARDSVNQSKLIYKTPRAIASILDIIQQRKITALTTETEFTWQKAISLWVQGEQEKAMFTLGHILHLIEDASVPEHTRNDPHPNDSPYENWTERFTLVNTDNDLSKRLANKTPFIFDNLETYFYELAKYSNNNFYSKDRIGPKSGYALPESDYFSNFNDGKTYGFKIDNEFGDYHLIIAPPKIVLLSLKPEELLSSDYIKKDYWSRLSTKAVQYGAGVIDLFFKEVEKAKQNQLLLSEQNKNKKSLLGQIINFIQRLFISGHQNRRFVDGTENQLSKNTEEIIVWKSDDLIIPETQEEIIEQPPTENLIKIQNQLNNLIQQTNNLRNQILELNNNNQANNQLVFSSASSKENNNSIGVFSAASAPTKTLEESSKPLLSESTETSMLPMDSNDATPAFEESTSSAGIPLINHIVISEILFDAVGNDEGKEFIELYNPTINSVELRGWSLRYLREDSSSTFSLASFTRVSDQFLIPAQGFLLIGLNNYDDDNYNNRTADIRRSNNLPNGGTPDNLLKITIKLFDDEDNEIDSLTYDASSITTEGQSLERQAWQNGQCLAAQQIGEFLGNGCDRDTNNDFDIRENPLPQNSESLPEPRNASAAPTFLLAQLTTTTLNFDFEWQTQVFDFPSVYQLFLETASGSQLIYQTTSTSYSYQIEEWDRDYNFSLKVVDEDGLSSASTAATITAPDWFLPVQTEINSNSQSSWYSDNWYQLGSGFYGVLLALTLEGGVDRRDFFSVSLQLKEFLDSNYTQLHKTFIISSQAPFSSNTQRVTIRGLNIPLQPNKYYRLDTYVERQNASLILTGTNTTGTAMFNAPLPRTEYYYQFYPYLTMIMQKNEPPLNPPAAPEIISSVFNEFNRILRVNWTSSTDADTSDDLISYQINFTTSGELSAVNWRSVNRSLTIDIPIDYDNPDIEYLIGVRAIDDFDNVSSSSVITWRLPSGFIAPILSNSNNSAYQDFVLNENERLNQLELFTNDFTSRSLNPDVNECFVELYEVSATSTNYLTQSEETYFGNNCAGRLRFSFSNISLIAGNTYRWLFSFNSNMSNVRFWGDSRNLAQGLFSDNSVTNAKFKIISSAGEILFNNLFGQY